MTIFRRRHRTITKTSTPAIQAISTLMVINSTIKFLKNPTVYVGSYGLVTWAQGVTWAKLPKISLKKDACMYWYFYQHKLQPSMAVRLPHYICFLDFLIIINSSLLLEK